MVGGINIHLYGCVSLLVSECAVYLCVYVCETHSKVALLLRYQGLSLSEITHQMWHGHPFSKTNKTSKIAGVGEGWKQQIEGLDKSLKRWVGNVGGFS